MNSEIGVNDKVIDIFRDRIYCDIESDQLNDDLLFDVTHNEVCQAIQASYVAGGVNNKVVDIFINENRTDIAMGKFSDSLPCDTKVIEVLNAMQVAFDAGQTLH